MLISLFHQRVLWHICCSLGWDDTIVDGLYDVWGQFPEIVEISPASGVTKLFPSLEELRKIPFTPGDSREVCVTILYYFSKAEPNTRASSFPYESVVLHLQTKIRPDLPYNYFEF